jgi:hypothetical protein
MSNPDDAFDFSGSDMDGLDDSQGAEESEPTQQEEGQEVDASQPPAPEGDDLDNEAEDLDLERDLKSRLEVAQLYQQVLAQGLIKANTPGAAQVTREIKRFVQERLRQLMGMGGGRGGSVAAIGGGVFDATEVQTLKQLAENGEALLALAQRVRQGANKAPVQQVQAITPAAPKVTPIQAQQPQQQAVRKLPLPKPPAAAPRPAAKPAAAPPRPVPTAGNKPPLSAIPALPAKVPVAKGQRQPTPAERERIDPQYRDDPTLLYKNLQWWVQVRDGDGVPLNVYDVKAKIMEPMLKNVTLPARPQGRQPLPMPNMRDASTWDQAMSNHSANSHATMAQVLDRIPGQGGRGVENAGILLAAGFAAPTTNSSSTDDEENRP